MNVKLSDVVTFATIVFNDAKAYCKAEPRNVTDFVSLYVMPIFVGVLRALGARTESHAISYNARKDNPRILGIVNAAAFAMRELIPNRHKTFGANVVVLGSLRSVDESSLRSGTFGERARNFLIDLLLHRPDIAEHCDVTSDDVNNLDNDEIVALYKIVNGGALNAEDYGFYRNTDAASPKFQSSYIECYKPILRKSEVELGTYIVTGAHARRAFSNVAKTQHENATKKPESSN